MSTSVPELTPLEQEFMAKIDARLPELEKFRNEYERLSARRREILGSRTPGRTGGAATRTAARPPGNGAAPAPRARQGDRKDEFLASVIANPGTTIPEIAKELGCAANYLYRVRDKAIDAGLIRKEEQQLFPAEVAVG